VLVGAVAAVWMAAGVRPEALAPIGLFEDQVDVGVPATIGPGSASYDAAKKTYTIAGGGENMWATADHFHYVWKKMSGDVTLSATIQFTATQPAGTTPVDHRKACLVLRQTLDADSLYADAAAHGNGMTALQWRAAKGDVSHDIETNIVGPKRLRIEKRGDYVSMFVADPGKAWRPAGGSTRIHLTGDFYVGLGVSSHSTDRIDTATFSDVEIATPAPMAADAQLVSTLETIVLSSKDRRVVHVSAKGDPIESPNWLQGTTNTLVYNAGGKLFRVRADLPRAEPNVKGPLTPEPVALGDLRRITGNHVLSRSGAMWAVTDESQVVGGQRRPLIFTASTGGGPARRVTSQSPSYVHGFSPDGRTIVYSGERDGNLDIYAMGVAGGDEQRLTTDAGRDEGAEFSPDGQSIYFTSDRGGAAQIWRMHADGTAQEAVTTDDQSNWSPHLSPDGRTLVFLSAAKGAVGRQQNGDVTLRRMNLADGTVDDLTTFFGGQGTMNVSSFAPTGLHLAFVSYQRIPR
jgi:Tol biopolymer transport system component